MSNRAKVLDIPGGHLTSVGGFESFERNEIRFWQIDLNREPAEVEMLHDVLSPDERIKASRFRFVRDRRRFIVARGALRLVIGPLIGILPENIRFAYERHGKPVLAPSTDASLHFNLSHSHELALVALSAQYPLGVDLEKVCDLPQLLDVASIVFNQEEISHLQNRTGDERLRDFFRFWTAKEALLKATGDGFFGRPREIAISLKNPRRPRVLSIGDDITQRWKLLPIPQPDDYVAHAAYRIPD